MHKNIHLEIFDPYLQQNKKKQCLIEKHNENVRRNVLATDMAMLLRFSRNVSLIGYLCTMLENYVRLTCIS